MPDKIIITAALSGAGTYRNNNPAVPYTPQEFADEAARCYKAGAAMVHIHARNDEGVPTPEIDRIQATYDAIKAKTPELIVNLSSWVRRNTRATDCSDCGCEAGDGFVEHQHHELQFY